MWGGRCGEGIYIELPKKIYEQILPGYQIMSWSTKINLENKAILLLSSIFCFDFKNPFHF